MQGYVHQGPVDDHRFPDTHLVVNGESLSSCHEYINYEWIDERRIAVSCPGKGVDIVTPRPIVLAP